MSATWINDFLQAVSENWMLLAIVKTSLVLSGVWLLASTRKRTSAAQRHLLWCLGMAAVLWVPIWQFIGPRLSLEVLPPLEAETQFEPGQATFNISPELAERIAVSPVTRVEKTEPAATVPINRDPAWWLQKTSVQRSLVGLYILVAGLFVLQLLAGLFRVAYLTSKSRPLNDPTELAAQLKAQIGIKQKIQCRVSPKVAMPFTWGMISPKVLLPEDFESWPEDSRRNVLIHEMAHIRRGDWLTGIFARICFILHWFNPLSWKAFTRLRLEAERACDDLVLGLGNSAPCYADQLLAFAGEANRGRHGNAAMVTMAFRSSFSERMLAILDQHERRHTLKTTQIIATVIMSLGLSGLLAGLDLKAQSNDITFHNDAKVHRTVHVIEDGRQSEFEGNAEAETEKNRSDLVDAFVDGFSDGMVEGLVEALKKMNENENGALDEAFGDALLDAVNEGNYRGVRNLLNNGANANFRKSGDGTALIIASRNGDYEMANLLLEFGANPNLAIAGDGSPLIQAARQGEKDLTILLIEAGADVNIGVAGDGAPLIQAVRSGDENLVVILLDAGANVNLGVAGDGNALISAAAMGRVDIARELINHGADVNRAVYGDESPLIQAIFRNQYAMVEFLIENGANVNQAVRYRDALLGPLDAAERKGSRSMIDLLKSHGAIRQN